MISRLVIIECTRYGLYFLEVIFTAFFRQNFVWMLKWTEIDGFTFRVLDSITKWNVLKQCDCFIAVFLSHGKNEALSCVDGYEVSWDLGG